MINGMEIWEQVRDKLKDNIGLLEFNESFEKINSIFKIQSGYIYLEVPTVLVKFRIDKFYLNRMNEILSSLTTEKMGFKTITTEDANKERQDSEKVKLTSVDEKERALSKRALRPEYTFDNFVTGESNRYAFLTATKVAESPHVTVNPLYIFGAVGLGKTHLMTAVGHFILDNNINTNVIYTTAQQFAEDYFIATSKRNTESLEGFYEYYRTADVLLVDDIQFLSGKTATQEEFFKVFEYLYENNKQIVLTSDRPASDLENIMARLKSRFSWGIPVDIKKPDINHRKSILKSKCAFLVNDPSDIGDDILEFIALNFDQNIRELEGALRRFVSYCVSFNIAFTLDNAKIALDSILPKNRGDENKFSSNDNVENVKRIVAKYFNLSVSDLTSTSRKQDIAYARQLTIYLIRKLYDLPLKKIGEFFNNRDHATIAHSLDKIENSSIADANIKQDIELLLRKVNNAEKDG
jgi:chromosomal replication initiator protein